MGMSYDAQVFGFGMYIVSSSDVVSRSTCFGRGSK